MKHALLKRACAIALAKVHTAQSVYFLWYKQRDVFFVWVAKGEIQGCGEGVKPDLPRFPLIGVGSPTEVGELGLPSQELVGVKQLMLRIGEAGRIFRGLQERLVLERLELLAGTVKLIGVRNFLGAMVGSAGVQQADP